MHLTKTRAGLKPKLDEIVTVEHRFGCYDLIIVIEVGTQDFPNGIQGDTPTLALNSTIHAR